jgi:hypothetical protein
MAPSEPKAPSPDDQLVAARAAAQMLQVARPLIWHDRKAGWPKKVDGATCFCLRFAGGIIGVTANHVVRAFESAFARNSQMVCQIEASPALDLMSAILARDEQRDIATFRVSENHAFLAGAVVVDCRGEWPPPYPTLDRAVSLCGYPENERIMLPDRAMEFRAWGALAAIDSVTDLDLIVTYDPDRDLPTPWAPAMPPLGMNLSGCSGGPVMMHGVREGVRRSFPIGVIVEGPRGAGEGGFGLFDMIRLRRIDCIRPDGSIAAR